MDEHEKILFFRSLEVRVQDKQDSVSRAKEALKVAKDAYDTAVQELRLAIRRKDGDENQLELHMPTGEETSDATTPDPSQTLESGLSGGGIVLAEGGAIQENATEDATYTGESAPESEEVGKTAQLSEQDPLALPEKPEDEERNDAA